MPSKSKKVPHSFRETHLMPLLNNPYRRDPRLLAHDMHHEEMALPFEWRSTREIMENLICRLALHAC